MKIDKAHFRECLLETLSDMFGPECISPLIRGDKMSVTVDDNTALIDLNTLVSLENILLLSLIENLFWRK